MLGVSRLFGALGLAIALAGCGATTEAAPPTERVQSAQEALRGVAQDGITLGAPGAPATLTVYVSLTELNGAFLRSDLPRLLDRFVRPGQLKIRLQPVTNAGDGSIDQRDAERLARLVLAAGIQDRLWDLFVAFDAVYEGYLDDDTVREALRLTPALDRAAAARDAADEDTRGAIRRANAGARRSGVHILPTYVFSRPDLGDRMIAGDCGDCLVETIATMLAVPIPTRTPEPTATQRPTRRSATRRPRKRPAAPAPPVVAATPAVTAAPVAPASPPPAPAPEPRRTAKPRPAHTPYPKIPARPKPAPTRYPRIKPDRKP